MKVLCAEYNPAGELAIIPVGDDVLLRNSQDFYIPEFTTTLSCVPQLVIRLGKLGKSIGERFADRYYEEIGVGVRFYADCLEEELRNKELPLIMASSFDNSAVISALVSKTDTICYSMSVNDEFVFENSAGLLPVGINRLISVASDFHTIKIGDFLYCGGLFKYRGLKIDDHIQMYLNGVCMSDFYIR